MIEVVDPGLSAVMAAAQAATTYVRVSIPAGVKALSLVPALTAVGVRVPFAFNFRDGTSCIGRVESDGVVLPRQYFRVPDTASEFVCPSVWVPALEYHVSLPLAVVAPVVELSPAGIVSVVQDPTGVPFIVQAVPTGMVSRPPNAIYSEIADEAASVGSWADVGQPSDGYVPGSVSPDTYLFPGWIPVVKVTVFSGTGPVDFRLLSTVIGVGGLVAGATATAVAVGSSALLVPTARLFLPCLSTATPLDLASAIAVEAKAAAAARVYWSVLWQPAMP